MEIRALIIFTFILAAVTGCYQQKDPRINLNADVRSNTFGSNVITKPISDLVNLIIGKGIVITEVKTTRNRSGFMVIQVRGFNESVSKRLFEYKTEWLDANGFVLDTVTDNWMPVSVGPTSEFAFRVVATRREASDYRINTRVDKKSK